MSPASERRAPAPPALALATWGVIVVASALHVALLVDNLRRVPAAFGYDWPGHLSYLFYLDRFGRTPPAALSPQYFNPPLYYWLVGLTHRLTGVELLVAGKLLNATLALLALVLVVLLCRLVWGNRPLPTAWWLAVYVLNPTVYRTFGMIRPEGLLLPIFLLALLLVLLYSRRVVGVRGFVVVSALLAGVAMGVRQWGAFLQVALWLWLLVDQWPRLRDRARPWRARLAPLLTQAALFVAVTLAFYLVRGSAVTAFNAPLNPSGPAFLLDLRLTTLLTTPIRPALDDRFWPILYADLWGDYWRYWIEALGRDPLASAPATVALLRRMVWGALPLSLLAAVGLLTPRVPDAAGQRWLRFTQGLTGVTLAGFAAFALLFAGGDKGDTVKSVYVVYLVPLLGWFAAFGSARLKAWAPRGVWGQPLLLLLAVVLLLPGLRYQAPARESQRVYTPLPVDTPVGETLGTAYELVGVTLTPGDAALDVTLVWHAADYSGLSYKVFVHALDTAGAIVAQSDAVPVQWQRPTIGWAPGEYLADKHTLTGDQLTTATALRVGLYDALSGTRLTTPDGRDAILLPIGRRE